MTPKTKQHKKGKLETTWDGEMTRRGYCTRKSRKPTRMLFWLRAPKGATFSQRAAGGRSEQKQVDKRGGATT